MKNAIRKLYGHNVYNNMVHGAATSRQSDARRCWRCCCCCAVCCCVVVAQSANRRTDDSNQAHGTVAHNRSITTKATRSMIGAAVPRRMLSVAASSDTATAETNVERTVLPRHKQASRPVRWLLFDVVGPHIGAERQRPSLSTLNVLLCALCVA